MLELYRFIVGLLFWISFPFLLIFVMLTGYHRRGVKDRLALYDPEPPQGLTGATRRLWIHAASIGEVRAAAILIARLKPALPDWTFLVTTMTVHGRDFARNHLDQDIPCYLAPLDVPFTVNRALSKFSADAYVCLETELWPVLISSLKRTGVAALLMNGRLSDKSISTYRRLRFLFGPVVQNFESIGAISEADRQRFIDIGAAPHRVESTGNIKDDLRLPEETVAIIEKWQSTLGLAPHTEVFVAASTHDPEEELILPLISKLIGPDSIAIIAPRHLDRLQAIGSLVEESKLACDLLSDLKKGRNRVQSLVLVDTFGDLSELYSIATMVFVGGSLSESGGHNVMEPAIWEKAVLFGPNVQDFKETSSLLEKCGGGFRVDDVEELEAKVRWLLQDRQQLELAGQRAGEAARGLEGAADRQAELITRSLEQIE